VRCSGFRDDVGLTTVPARVIAVAPSNFEWTLTIDAGSDDGIERGMAVVAAEGLVGRVLTTTSERLARAARRRPELLRRCAQRRDVRARTARRRGSEPMRFAPLDPGQIVDEDDEIVTATFPGSAIPSGIPIGRIVAQDERSSRLSARLRPPAVRRRDAPRPCARRPRRSRRGRARVRGLGRARRADVRR
jgi:rod shape-determining protein MreC